MSRRIAFFSIMLVVLLAAFTPRSTYAQRDQRGSEAGEESDRERDPLASAVRALRFRSIGPAVVSGRISDVAVHPTDRSTWYVATASGGLWKTTNAGTTFSPIFDSEGSYSLGVVVIDPNNPNVIWVGSGEANSQRSVSYGDGVYKSIDGGQSWRNVGLPESEHIGKILIDPRNSDVVYVAAHGPLFRGGGDRGLFKTTDGGETWDLVLDGGEWGGAADAVMDPRNPDVLIVATWQRARRQWTLIAGGPESGVHRTTDGGETWMESQRGLPSGDLGRIGLTISPANPDVVYAIVEAAENSGFYRSQNNGITWERMSDEVTSSNYYQEIVADPVDVDRVYVMNVRNMVSDDGGRTFRPVGERNKHVDNHSIWIDPDDTDHLIIGCDGGLYETFDGGQTYDWFQNLPLGQFYRVEVDSVQPFYRVFGGTQDNSTLGGPSQTRTRLGARNADWILTQGGDGFVTRIDPTDPNIVYSESQYAGLTRFNLATGERVSIRPEVGPDEGTLVWHWDSPLIISPHSPSRLYFAANRLFRSDDRGSSWALVSPDLTRQIDRNRLEVMGRVWGVDAVAKNRSTSVWGSIVSLAESPLQEGLLFAGTDDGMIQISEDGGANWRAISSVRGIPDTTFIVDIQPSWHDVNTVYVAFDNHKAGDYKPYIAKSTDLGRSWETIHSDLPERGTVYTILEDYKDPSLLFAGTEFGAFFSHNGGENWLRIRGGLPTIMVRDMVFQTQHDDLVIATFGRGFYILHDLEMLRALTPELLASEGGLLPVQRTPMFVSSNPDPGWQGERFYTADNPEQDAVFHYYLKETIRTRRQERQRADRAAARRGEDVFYPPWDSLRVEDLEESPQMILTVTDQDGNVVRRLSGRTSAGVTTVTWNLRYPSSSPVTSGGSGFGDGGGGPYVLPGTYTVSLAKLVDGVLTPVGEPQRFEVYLLDGDTAPRSPEVLAFQQQTARLQRAMLGANAAAGEAMTRVEHLRRALEQTPAADPQLLEDLRALEDDLREWQWAINGDPTRSRRNEASPTSLMRRLYRFTGGAWSGSLSEVTGLQREQYEIVAAEFGGMLERLRQLVEVELARIENAAEAAGAPWTSGRIPEWRR